jgi:hypothetical protein
MSDEISITIAASLSNAQLKDSIAISTKRYDQGSPLAYENTVALTSNSTNLYFGLVAPNPGWCVCTNLSTANELLIGPSSGNELLKCPPTATAVFPVNTTSMTGRTVSGIGTIHYKIWGST